MKKKFLSLMMAAAVVATTSVNAFAASEETVTKNGGEVKVTITGSVNGPDNAAPEGTISVTIPTALAFTVNNDGEVGGTSLKIQNNGTENVEIYAYQFIDKNGIDGINVVKELGDRTSQKTNNVVLKLGGNEGTVGFVSNGDGNGIYDARKTSPDASPSSGEIKIASLDKLGEQNTGTIDLTGTAGKVATGVTAVREQFTVKLKVKKKTAQLD